MIIIFNNCSERKSFSKKQEVNTNNTGIAAGLLGLGLLEILGSNSDKNSNNNSPKNISDIKDIKLSQNISDEIVFNDSVENKDINLKDNISNQPNNDIKKQEKINIYEIPKESSIYEKNNINLYNNNYNSSEIYNSSLRNYNSSENNQTK